MASAARAAGWHGGGTDASGAGIGGDGGAAARAAARGRARSRPGALRAVRLAAALLVCAGLHLAPDGDARAQTQGAESDPPGPTPADTTDRVQCTRDVLNARLTVGEGGGVRGFDAAADAGALSATGFDVRGKRYAIDALGVVPGGDGALRVSLASALESDHGLILYVGGERFEFAGSTYRSGSHTVEWAGAGLDWTPGSTVAVRIAQRIERLTSRDLGKPVLQRSDRLPYADGDTLWLTHGNLPLNRECLPPADAFRVTGDGTGIAVEAVSISYATVTLTLERALTAGAEVRVSYTAPEDNALQNGYGTETDGFAGRGGAQPHRGARGADARAPGGAGAEGGRRGLLVRGPHGAGDGYEWSGLHRPQPHPI